jgi:sugar transferase (PEP-CTERM/EpsH1 system associated)
MKILFISAEPPWPLDQGDKLRNFHLLKALAEEHDITLVCFYPPEEQIGHWQAKLAPFCRKIHTVPLSRRKMIFNALRLPHLPVTMAARASVKMAKSLRKLTSQEQFNIAFACQLKTAGYLKHCAVDKRVVDLTDVVSLYQSKRLRHTISFPSKIIGSIDKRRLAYWERHVTRQADLTLLVSPVDAEELRNMAPEAHIAVVPNGVDTKYFSPLPDTDEPLVIFYGHLRYPPNADGIVWFCHEALPRVKESVKDAKLLIIGKEPPPAVASLAGLPGVEIIGYVPDLRPYLARAAVVVVPLRFGSGIRNKVLEAFASEKAVVSTSLGCEGIGVLPGKHLEMADEPSSFADAVIRLLQDKNHRTYLAAEGLALIQQEYNWNKIGKKLHGFLEELKV